MFLYNSVLYSVINSVRALYTISNVAITYLELSTVRIESCLNTYHGMESVVKVTIISHSSRSKKMVQYHISGLVVIKRSLVYSNGKYRNYVISSPLPRFLSRG